MAGASLTCTNTTTSNLHHFNQMMRSTISFDLFYQIVAIQEEPNMITLMIRPDHKNDS